jgi:hypothetical protein
MFFSTKQQNYNLYIQNQNQNQSLLPLTLLNRNVTQNNNIIYEDNSNIQNSINNEYVVEAPKKMKWGEPTWFLFHTLAHKLKESHFDYLRLEILNIITLICNNLPCPNCASHATEYMKKINYNSIKTKEDLKKLLFQFHNEVNLRKGFVLFPYNKLDEKYSKAITIHIIQHFMIFFQDKHKSIHMIANDMHRERIAQYLKKWFNENIQYFDN